MAHLTRKGLSGWLLLALTLSWANAIHAKCSIPTINVFRVNEQQVATNLFTMLDCGLFDYCSGVENYDFGPIDLLSGESVRVDFGGYYDFGQCPTFNYVVKRDGDLIHLHPAGGLPYDGLIVHLMEPGNYEVWLGYEDAPYPDIIPGPISFTIRTVETPPDCVRVRLQLALDGARINLNGSYDSQRTDLAQLGFLPVHEPYSAMGYQPTEATADIPIDESSIWPWSCLSNYLVDWVIVELRDATDPSIVIARKAEVLTKAGEICDLTNGKAPIFNVPQGLYHIAVRHRNHFGVCTSTPVLLKDIPTTIVDLRSAQFPVWGSDTRNCVAPTKCSLRMGDTTHDGIVKYAGSGNDRDPILARIGGYTPTNTAVGYFPEDLNLDGTVKYTGANNDRDPILQAVGGSTPTAVIFEQLP
jgi:hypothetical protein